MTPGSAPFHLKLTYLVFPKLAKTLMAKRLIAAERSRATERIRHMQSPAIQVPALASVQAIKPAEFEFPDTQVMVDELSTVCMVGAQVFFEQSLDVARPANPKELFGLHPDVSVSKALYQILGAAFPDDTYLEITTYFTRERQDPQRQPQVYYEDRVRYMYALWCYIDGSPKVAESVERLIPVTEDLKALRDRVSLAKNLFDPDAKVDHMGNRGRTRFDPFETLVPARPEAARGLDPKLN